MADYEKNNQEKNGQNEVSFEIEEHIAVLHTNNNCWTKEVNLVSWNGGKPKIDIRDWDMNHEKMSRGITLTEKEADKLARALTERAFERGPIEPSKDSWER